MWLQTWNKYCLVVTGISKEGIHNEMASHCQVGFFSSWNAKKNEINIYQNFCKICNSIIKQEMHFKLFVTKNDLECGNSEEFRAHDSKANSCSRETGRSASWLHCSSPQMCAVTDDLQECVPRRWGCLTLLLNQNTVEIILGISFISSLNKQAFPGYRAVNLLR